MMKDGGKAGDGEYPFASQHDRLSILVPTLPFQKLRISEKLADGKKKKLFKGERINAWVEGPDDPYYFYIDEGQIAIRMPRESGEFVTTFWRSAGNALSVEYAGFASAGGYMASFEAVEDTVLFSFTQRQLYAFAMEDPYFFYEFVFVCHMTFAQLGHRIGNTAFQSPAKRVLMWLRKASSACEPSGDGTFVVPCNMTLKQISELLLIHPTTCTKIFSKLEQNDILERTKTSIRIHDLDKLEAFLSEKI